MRPLLATLAAAAVLVPTAAAAGPTLTVASRAPLAVTGAGFPHATRVLLTLTPDPGTPTRTVKAQWVKSSTTGRFSARFLTVTMAPTCKVVVYTLTAKVAGRVRATVQIAGPHSRDCAPPIQP